MARKSKAQKKRERDEELRARSRVVDTLINLVTFNRGQLREVAIALSRAIVKGAPTVQQDAMLWVQADASNGSLVRFVRTHLRYCIDNGILVPDMPLAPLPATISRCEFDM